MSARYLIIGTDEASMDEFGEAAAEIGLQAEGDCLAQEFAEKPDAAVCDAFRVIEKAVGYFFPDDDSPETETSPAALTAPAMSMANMWGSLNPDEEHPESKFDNLVIFLPKQDWNEPNAQAPLTRGNQTASQEELIAASLFALTDFVEVFVFVPTKESAAPWFAILETKTNHKVRVMLLEDLPRIIAAMRSMPDRSGGGAAN